MALSIAEDGTPVYTAAQERKKRTCSCLEKGIRDCKCDRIYNQSDCNIGWDSHRERCYFGYDLYMLTASDSENDLPVFPFLEPASRHDSIKGRTNSNVLKSASLAEILPAPVKIPIPMPNTAGLYISLWLTAQDCSIPHQEAVKNGSWNITQRHLQNATISVRNWTINWKTADTVHSGCGTAASSAS